MALLQVGPGLGRLVRYILEAAEAAGAAAQVLAIEANGVAVSSLKLEFKVMALPKRYFAAATLQLVNLHVYCCDI